MRERKLFMRLLPLLSTLVMLALLVGVWELLIDVGHISKYTLPAPSTVGSELGTALSSSTIWQDTVTTLIETISGFGIALTSGIVVGTILGRVRWLEVAMRPTIVTLQVVPKVALIPLFVIWMGFGSSSKIVIAAILSFFPIMLNVLLGVRSVDTGHRDVMSSLNSTRWATFRHLELPSTLPYVFTGMEVGIVLAVIGAIVGEYLGGNQGLGYEIITSLNNLDAPRLYAIIVLLALLGSLLYFAISGLKRLVIPWHESVATTAT